LLLLDVPVLRQPSFGLLSADPVVGRGNGRDTSGERRCNHEVGQRSRGEGMFL